MKAIVTVLFTVFATSAFACPNLAGKFLCKSFDNGVDQHVTVTQQTLRDGVAYRLNIAMGDKLEIRNYMANGIAQSVTNPKYNNYTERSFCDGALLKVETRGMVKGTNEVLNALVTVKINPDGSMYDSYVGTVGGKQIRFEETCQKM